MRNKYGNRRVTMNGETFDSQKEARRYAELELLQRAGEIRDLKRQTRFTLMCGTVQLRYSSGRAVVYVADYTYADRRKGWAVVIEDAKGCRTDVYKLKRAIMKANGYEILET